MDKFRSCTSHNWSCFLCDKHHLNWKYIVLKHGDTLLQCFHMIVVQYHILLKKMNHLWKHNFNSSTRPISVSKVRNLPGVFNRLATLDAVPPVYSSKNPPHNRMLYLVCSQVVSYQCPATVQPVTFKIIFSLIVPIDCGRTCNVKWTKLVVY